LCYCSYDWADVTSYATKLQQRALLLLLAIVLALCYEWAAVASYIGAKL
jgi:hypothetical protein